MLDKTGIAALIPHEGAMCLLDRVEHWDQTTIRCRTSSHRDPANPLATEGRLGAACAIEYAAQAMAVHGGLAGSVAGRPRAGYLASIRAVTLHEDRLDTLDGDLVIDVERLAGDGASVVYGFHLTCRGAPVASGRAAVMLEAEAR
jgi:predicted hotdog family 3-hydroxylacyl-ACP dehydratase